MNNNATNLASRESLDDLIAREVRTISDALRRRGIDAGTHPGMVTVCGGAYIFYRLLLGRSETVQRVIKHLPEIDEALTGLRGRPTQARPWLRPLGLEIVHPSPYPLRLLHGLPELKPHSMLAGRHYGQTGPSDVLIDLNSQPHTLIAGITGAGKSVAMQGLLLSLCANTSPEELEIVVIDLKNEEGADLAQLPHVGEVAVTAADAQALIERVHTIKEERVQAGRWTGQRLVLVIDELAEVFRSWRGCETVLGNCP